ncbi:MAG: metallophosphoesterase [Candidatus Woesearchaeota archaeon]
MKISYATDLHGNETLIENFISVSIKEKVDAIIFGGDICPRGFNSLDSRINIQKQFLENHFVPLIKRVKTHNPIIEFYLIFGNDDYRVNYEILLNNEIKGHFHLLHQAKKRIRQYTLIGYSYVNITPFSLKDWEKDDFAAIEPQGVLTTPRSDYTSIKSDLLNYSREKMEKTIFVTHAPPYGTNCDILHDGRHVGSKAIKEFIEKYQPLLVLSGHIHESPAISRSFQDQIGKTVCINPGSDPFNNTGFVVIAQIKPGTILEIKRIKI